MGAAEQGAYPEEATLAADPLSSALEELALSQDRLARLQAEWDNFRKRTAAERSLERQTAAAKLVEKLLPVIDDLERATEHTDGSSVEALAEGLGAVLSKLRDILESEGLQAIDPEGQPFDMNLHQAVMREEDPTIEEETVTKVLQKGYRMRDKILRTAMVAVSTGGPVRKAADSSDEDRSG